MDVERQGGGNVTGQKHSGLGIHRRWNQRENIMVRKATAVWTGTVKEGAGTLTTDTKTLNVTPYSFRSRFEDGNETNPEELIAAAHAGCFSMALSLMLGNEGITPEKIETEAALTMEPVDGAPTITKVHITTKITAPGADEAKVREAAANAKAGCPVSRVLKAELSLDITIG